MLNIKLSLLIISLLVVVVVAQQPFRPSKRITEPDKVSQHVQVQDEIYKNMSRIKVVQDSSFVQWGLDSIPTGASQSNIIYLNDKYESSTSFSIVVTQRSSTVSSITMSALAVTNNSFIVYRSGTGYQPIYWMTVGIKE